MNQYTRKLKYLNSNNKLCEYWIQFSSSEPQLVLSAGRNRKELKQISIFLVLKKADTSV